MTAKPAVLRFWRWLVLLVFFSVVVVVAQEPDTDGLTDDPYLEYKPAFVRSLPVQILVTGVVFTLVAVLFVHLIFTGQYHWPLAPVNYVLQLSGVTTLLISLIATLHVVLQRTISESDGWPYMVSYIAVNVPPSEDSFSEDSNIKVWTIAERATWSLMTATTSVLVQITHIQFLTLLYPSTLERRLIFSLLGPLAILSAVMQLLPISASPGVVVVASDIRNVCNATLSLLFTASLFIWGLLVNRANAWRTDGGTAVFGIAALSLAIASTGLNFLYVPREEEYVWLPGLMWAVVLWQSFMGWWWWVGSSSSGFGDENMGTTEEVMEHVLRRGQKVQNRRRERRKQQLESREREREQGGSGGTTTGTAVGSSSSSGGWRSVFSNSNCSERGTARKRKRRRPRMRTDEELSDAQSHTSPSTSSAAQPSSSRSRIDDDTRGSRRRTLPSDHEESTSNTSNTSTGTLPGFLPQSIHNWYANIRQAHLAAARQQAQERRERIREMRGEGRLNRSGWGLGSSAVRRAEMEIEMDELSSRSRNNRRGKEVTSDEEDPYTTEAEAEVAEDADPEDEPESSAARRRGRVDVDVEANASEYPPHSIQLPPPEPRRRSVWWWEPFRRWRLQDSTIY
ncbi:hypothetical protein Moror_17797 [Moniliophthora roreri MCA 2997]|uniref:Uncharacterized protein n=1 Tax=Moniliophthora roreri (strain MCA 2997) TaxID=1381753 RepID=V2XWX0_MONRO|nr:hypothetical protein Moror_17797 [Moniliophthora roreri MCA 2997]